MKTRKLILMFVAGVMLFAANSCHKPELSTENPDETPKVESTSGVTTLFTATFEIPGSPSTSSKPQQTAAGTKITVEHNPDNNQVTPHWEIGDEIKIFYKDPETSEMTSVTGTAVEAGRSTSFEATVPLEVTEFYAVHPASLASSVDAEGNFVVPISKANPTFTNACISIAKCGSDKILQFKNLCSVLKFTVGTRGNVMKVASIDGSAITGKINASLDADGNVKYAEEPYTNTNNVVEMNLIPTGSVNTECYIPILPGTQAAGVAIDYANVTKLPAVFADFAIPFERSHIYSLGTVDSHLVTDFYITVSGSGDKSGKSWENAGDVNTFKTLVGYMADANKGKKYAQILRTKGTTFHFGAGKYVFGNAANDRLTIDFYGANGSLYSEFTIQGGYPANGGDEVSSDNVTTFSGDDKYGILNVFDRARVHINDVTFANAYTEVATADASDINENNFGAALYMKQMGSGAKSAPRVWLTDCVFKQNRTNHSASTHIYEGGSCINLVHGAVYADCCVFRNNLENKRNGCVKISGGNLYDDETAYAFFNACVFTENEVETDASGQGSTILRNYRKGSLLGLYNCVFYNNQNSGHDNANHIKRNIITLDRSAIIANCTIIDDFNTSTDSRPIRVRADYDNHLYNNKFIFANNLIIDKSGSDINKSINIIGTKRKELRLYMEGGNVYGSGNGTYFTNNTNTIINNTNEKSDVKYSDLDNASFSNNMFMWNGTLNNGATTFAYMSKAIMETNVLKSENINDESFTFSITGSNGDESFAGFYTWLNSIGAIDKDATGATRPDTGWTPGAYQAQ